MNDEKIELWKSLGILRQKRKDTALIRSQIQACLRDADVARKIALTEESANVVFKEIYTSIRLLGEARWRLRGFETSNHEICLEILKEADIKAKMSLAHLDRYIKFRHEATYEGLRIGVDQVKEIISFWENCCKEIANKTLKELED